MAIFSTPCAFFGARSAAMRPEKAFGCGKNSSFFPPRRPAASSLLTRDVEGLIFAEIFFFRTKNEPL
jgi:hypothetical protein